jgi:transposase
MDTSEEASATDTLGRSVPPRRYRTAAEKRQIVEETLVRGASVAVVARRHEVNANLVFGWRKLYHKGLLGAEPKVPVTPLLPVQITEGVPARRGKARRVARGAGSTRIRPKTAAANSIEIDLVGSDRVQLFPQISRTFFDVRGSSLREESGLPRSTSCSG